MRILKHLTAFILVCCMLLTLAACGKDDEDFDIRIAMTGTPQTYDPAMVTTDEERIIVSHLNENLMKLMADGTATAGQARTYTCTDNLDGTETYTFTLRTDIYWSTGESVKASDFVYAWQRLVNPATGSPNASLLNMVAGYDEVRNTGDVTALKVSAESDTVFTVVLNCHCPYFIAGICTNAATMPVRMGYEGSAGNGAYHKVSGDETSLVLKATKKYYDSEKLGPNILTFLFSETQSASVELYNNGEADFVLGLSGTEAADLSDDLTADSSPVVGTLIVNTMNSKLSRSTLLQAMSSVIDRDSIVEELGNTEYLAAEGLIPYGIVRSVGGMFRDVAGARITNGSEGYEERCNAVKSALLEVGYTSEYLTSFEGVTLRYEATPEMAAVARNIAEDWQEQLGITVSLYGMEREEMQLSLERGEFTIALIEMTSDRNDASGYLDTWQSGSMDNYIFFNNSAYDMLLRVAAAAGSGEARDAYLEDAERLLLEEGNVIPIYTKTITYELRSDLTGLYSNGMGVYYFNTIKTATE